MSFPTTAHRGDTRLAKWQKALGALQNLTGALSKNNPSPRDTLRITIFKFLRAIQGIDSPDP